MSIFTHIAISPSPSLRQFSNRYAIRAGRNLPDKEFRYLRTVIVTAGVHPRFGSGLAPLPLTFGHWPGISPYTSACALAGTCVFGKQSLEIFRCTRQRATLETPITNSQIPNKSQDPNFNFQNWILNIGCCFLFGCWRLELGYSSALRWRGALSRSYGRCFAEFLNEGCLVRLGLLDLFTCVGLRYGLYVFNPRGFSRQPACSNWVHPKAFPALP